MRDDIDLEGLLKLARSLELSDAQARDIEERVNTTETAHHMTKKPQAKAKQNSYRGKCGWCGGERHPKAECPAKDRECGFCSKIGHYKAVCRGYAQEKTKQKPKYKKSQKAYRVNEKVTKAESNTDTEEEYCFGVGKHLQ